jgi:hypothetical protein
MNKIMEDIGKEVGKFIFYAILAWFFFWTGEIIAFIFLSDFINLVGRGTEAMAFYGGFFQI